MFSIQYELKDIIEVAELLGLTTPDTTNGSEYGYLCPIHGDTKPSLFINVDKQVWYCYGCQQGGNAASLCRLFGVSLDRAYDTNKPARRQSNICRTPGTRSGEYTYYLLSLVVDKIPPALLRNIDVAAATGSDEELVMLLDTASVHLWK